jgi:hypothetical protein
MFHHLCIHHSPTINYLSENIMICWCTYMFCTIQVILHLLDELSPKRKKTFIVGSQLLLLQLLWLGMENSKDNSPFFHHHQQQQNRHLQQITQLSQLAKLQPSQSYIDEGLHFGTDMAVAISNGTIVVGGTGGAFVYRLDQESQVYSETAFLTAHDAQPGDWFGDAVAIDFDTIVVSANHLQNPDGTGAVYVFCIQQETGEVTFLSKIVPSDTEAEGFGISIAIQGDTMVVGCDADDIDGIFDSGSAYIFVDVSGMKDSWTEVGKLVPYPLVEYNYGGAAVGISGDTIVLRTSWHDAAYVFQTYDGKKSWTQLAELIPSSGQESGYCRTVAVSPNWIVLSARYEDSIQGVDAGAVYLYQRFANTSWTETIKLTADDVMSGSFFGCGVAISEDESTIAVGACGDCSKGSNSGAAYLFHEGAETDNMWTLVGKFVPEDGTASDYLGISIAISGNVVVVGAEGDVHDGSPFIGSVYVLQNPPALPIPSKPGAQNVTEPIPSQPSENTEEQTPSYIKITIATVIIVVLVIVLVVGFFDIFHNRDN